MESTSSCNSLIVYSLKWRCCSFPNLFCQKLVLTVQEEIYSLLDFQLRKDTFTVKIIIYLTPFLVLSFLDLSSIKQCQFFRRFCFSGICTKKESFAFIVILYNLYLGDLFYFNIAKFWTALFSFRFDPSKFETHSSRFWTGSVCFPSIL